MSSYGRIIECYSQRNNSFVTAAPIFDYKLPIRARRVEVQTSTEGDRGCPQNIKVKKMLDWVNYMATKQKALANKSQAQLNISLAI